MKISEYESSLNFLLIRYSKISLWFEAEIMYQKK